MCFFARKHSRLRACTRAPLCPTHSDTADSTQPQQLQLIQQRLLVCGSQCLAIASPVAIGWKPERYLSLPMIAMCGCLLLLRLVAHACERRARAEAVAEAVKAVQAVRGGKLRQAERHADESARRRGLPAWIGSAPAPAAPAMGGSRPPQWHRAASSDRVPR